MQLARDAAALVLLRVKDTLGQVLQLRIRQPPLSSPTEIWRSTEEGSTSEDPEIR